MILNYQYELNEAGDIFINGIWMRTSVYNELWLNNSKLIESKFVYPYVQRLKGTTGGMYVVQQTVFSNKKFIGNIDAVRALNKNRKKIVSKLNRKLEECI